MNGEFVTILALLSVIAGFTVIGTIQLAVIAWHLGDLKAYTMTQISLLQSLDKKSP